MKVLLALALGVFTTVQAVQFHITNKEAGPVWVGVQGNPGKEHLHGGGFVLDEGQSITLNAADDWAGRFWGRTWCYSDTMTCQTGDCGPKIECNGAGGRPPATLAEITLRGWGDVDYYDISLVDGYNLRVSMEPVGGQGDGGQYSCKRCACSVNLLDNCPSELKIVNGEGYTIACNSACGAFNTDEYCCRGNFGTPDTCVASRWPRDYPKFFKDNCPDAYSYAYDDHKSTFTCKADAYNIVFG